MKISISKLLPIALLMSCAAFAQTAAPSATPEAESPPAFSNRKDAMSYAIGVSTARNLQKDGVEVNAAIVAKGMEDALSGKRTLMSEKEIRSVMSGLVGEMRQKMAANRVEAEAANKKRGDEYRAAYAKQAGVKNLPNGVLYKVEAAGSGPKPTEDDMVVVNYRGTLTNGTEFDGTPEGKPATMKLSQLILGWKEALKNMPTGARWTLVIPPQLAYGVRGVGSDIGPSETLVFDVELVGIKK
jgi:FKBP-type peptidyl-prolyl cis-trans isomerase FklB